MDITQIPLTDSHNFLALLNFNIPADHPDIEGCLQNIVGFLERNFGVENQPSITYQVTASYYLRRPDNGDERIWTGSFVAGSDQNCSLSGHLFALYDRESFAGVFRRSVSHQNVVDRLTWRDVDTEWQFSHVKATSSAFSFDSMSLTPSFSISDSFRPTGGDRLADTSQSSTLRDLLDLLCNSGRRLDWKPDSLPRELSSLLDLPLDVFLKKHRKLACFVQEFARTRFVVKQKVSRDSYRLLFEGRFLSADLSSNFKPFAQNKPTWHIALDKEGHVVKCSKKPSSLPKSHVLPKSAKAPGPSFGELVLGKELASRRGCNLPEQDPQSQPEAVRLLAEWGVSERVNVNFCVCLLPKSVPVCWIYPAVATPQRNVRGSYAWKHLPAPRTDSDSERKL